MILSWLRNRLKKTRRYQPRLQQGLKLCCRSTASRDNISEHKTSDQKEDLNKTLEGILDWKPSFEISIESDRISALTQELYNLRTEFQSIQNKIDAAETFAQEEQAF